MSTQVETSIVCDHERCTRRYVVSLGEHTDEARARMRTRGWFTQHRRTKNDYCPEHSMAVGR